MKFLPFAMAALITLGIAVAGSAQKEESAQTFTGYVMTKACISHKNVATENAVNEAAECSKKPTQARVDYVLYDPDAKMSYDLVDQKRTSTFAGEDVNLVGYVDVSSRAIHISEITPFSN